MGVDYHFLEKPVWTADAARETAAELLGYVLDGADCGACPGAHLHSTRSGRRDFKLFVTGDVPAFHCVHNSCAAVVDGMNRELWRRLFRRSGAVVPVGMEERRPKAARFDKRRMKYDEDALRSVQRSGLIVSGEWLRERSAIDPAGVTTEGFLSLLFSEDERVLIFTNEWSQGDFGFRPGAGWKRLGQDRRSENVTAAHGPRSGKYGAWFLNQPVSGRWVYDAQHVERPWSRRRASAVTSWRHMVLESDDAPAHLWLNFLVQLELPILALYTSGGRSIHALVKVDAPTMGWWNLFRDRVQPLLTRLGADGGALSAVRLTRLPGVLREGKRGVEVAEVDGKRVERDIYVRYKAPQMQRLIFFNPLADGSPILAGRRWRVISDEKMETQNG